MKKKILSVVNLVAIFITVIALPAFAADPIPVQTPDSLGQKIVDIVKQTGMPIGGAIMLGSMAFIFIKMIITANNPNKRAEAIGALGYVAFGGIGLGGILFLAGAILGVGKSVFGG